MPTTGFFLNQYFTTTLNVGGGIDNSQTTGIIISDVSEIDTAKPGVMLINYADPLNTAIAEWVTYTSIDGSKELQGVVRGAEGYSAKSHDNSVSVAFPLSESHINNLATALSIGGTATNLVTTTLDEDTMSSDSATALATQQSIKAYVDIKGVDGWTSTTDTWVYVSASTFKIEGVDKTAIYTKGTRLKFSQTTAKYAVVVSSTFSTDTTVTIAVNTDYTIANATITSPFYSYQDNPQGYPHWFTFTSTWGGFSGDPTPTTLRYCVSSRKCRVQYTATANGTSNATTLTATLPFVSARTESYHCVGRAVDNGSVVATPAMVLLTATSASADFRTAQSEAGWTGSAAKSINFGFEYEI